MAKLPFETLENAIEVYKITSNPKDNLAIAIISFLKELKTYRKAEEQGLLVRLPYNIGTCGIVYYVDEKDREIYSLQADKIEIYKMMISNKFVYTIDCYDFFYEDFGKIVFTTKEEAEAALQKMQEGE